MISSRVYSPATPVWPRDGNNLASPQRSRISGGARGWTASRIATTGSRLAAKAKAKAKAKAPAPRPNGIHLMSMHWRLAQYSRAARRGATRSAPTARPDGEDFVSRSLWAGRPAHSGLPRPPQRALEKCCMQMSRLGATASSASFAPTARERHRAAIGLINCSQAGELNQGHRRHLRA